MSNKDKNPIKNAMRMFSQMLQDDPVFPEEIRVDFAAADAMDDLLELISCATKEILVGDAPLETKKAWLEYLQLTKAAAQTFLDAHGLTVPQEEDG